MADAALQAPDAGQVVAITNETLHSVAGLAPSAQVAAVVMLGAVALLFLWTRRPAQTGGVSAEVLSSVIAAINEQATATANVAASVERAVDKVEQVVEQQAVLIMELKGGAVLHR